MWDSFKKIYTWFHKRLFANVGQQKMWVVKAVLHTRMYEAIDCPYPPNSTKCLYAWLPCTELSLLIHAWHFRNEAVIIVSRKYSMLSWMWNTPGALNEGVGQSDMQYMYTEPKLKPVHTKCTRTKVVYNSIYMCRYRIQKYYNLVLTTLPLQFGIGWQVIRTIWNSLRGINTADSVTCHLTAMSLFLASNSVVFYKWYPDEVLTGIPSPNYGTCVFSVSESCKFTSRGRIMVFPFLGFSCALTTRLW